MSLPRYSSYKDSGVEWLGEVPSHWPIWKLSHAYELIGSGTTPKADNTDYYDNGNIPWLNTGDLNDGLLFSCEKKVTEKALEDHSSLKLFRDGALAIAMYGATIGKLALLHFETTVNQACCVFSGQSKIKQKFLFYWFIGMRPHIISMATGGGQPNISQEILRSIKVPAPDKDEQDLINTFLDRETGKIDALVAEQERLIALLTEKRQAVISHAVTKGLNPTASMKPSGIDWLGDIPAHWKVIAIKWLSPVYRGASPRPIEDPRYFDDNGEYSWVRIADVSASKGILYETTQKLSDLGSSLSVKIEPDTIFISIAGTVGKPCISAIKACIHDGFVYFPKLQINHHYLYRIFESGECYAGLGKWGTQLNLNTDTIGSIRIALPPEKEMESILSNLDKMIAKLDALTAEAERVINLLQERRTALISAAVTGKIDVRGQARKEQAA